MELNEFSPLLYYVHETRGTVYEAILQVAQQLGIRLRLLSNARNTAGYAYILIPPSARNVTLPGESLREYVAEVRNRMPFRNWFLLLQPTHRSDGPEDFRAYGITVVHSVSGLLQASTRRKQLLSHEEVDNIRQPSLFRIARALLHDLRRSPIEEALLRSGAECIAKAVEAGKLPPSCALDHTPEGIIAGLGILLASREG